MYKKIAELKFGHKYHLLSKFFLTMKFTIVLMLVTLLQVKASIFAQRVSLSVKNATLTEVISEIRKQTNVDILYNNSTITGLKPITLTVNNANVIDVLNQCFANQPVTYRVEGQTILVVAKPVSTESVPLAAKSVTINGKVSDEKGEPLIGVSVKVKGSTTGTTTDVNGAYKLTVNEGAVLVFSYLGYENMEVTVGNKTEINVKLKPHDSGLSEVVVVGYGQQKKATVTGAIATLDAHTFQDRGPTNNPIANIQGEVPGVVVTRTSAQPGRENWNFQIRGVASVNSQDPLIVLDGVALNNNNELNSINPDDIDNISFLKDGSAAIYGARAAYGVVLITTKRGKVGKTRIEYDPSVSEKFLGLQPQTVSLTDWANGVSQALTNDSYGVAPTGYVWYQYAQFALGNMGSIVPATAIPGYNGSAITPGLFYNGLPVPTLGDVKEFDFTDTRMSDVLWGNSTSQSHNFSMSGGNEKNLYRFSLGYLNDGSQLKWGTNGNQRYNIRLSNDYKFNDNVTWNNSISLERNDIQQPTLYSYGSYGALSTSFQPGLPALTQSGRPYGWGTVSSPPGLLRDGGDNLESNTRILLNSTLNYQFLKHLKLTTTVGYNTWYQDQQVQVKQVQLYSYYDTNLIATNPSAGGTTSNGSNISESYYRQNVGDVYYNLMSTLTYSNTFNKQHNVMLMLGGSYERDEYDTWNAKTFNLASDDIAALGMGLTNGNAGYVTDGETKNHYALGSYLGRATYDYKGKYLFEVAGRYDGSSKFVADKRWKAFYSLQLGWRMSEEDFIKKLNIFDNLKLRASYGTSGNQAGIGLYDYQQLLNVGLSGTLLGQSIATATTTTGTLVSLDRTWETVRKSNIGLDFDVLHGHLSGSFDVFDNRNSNMLISVTYPGTLGATAPQSNNGDLKVWGWEGQLTYRNHIGKVNFSVSGNITDNQNKLLYYNGTPLVSSGYNATVEGYPLGSYFGLQYGGKLQNQAQVDAYNNTYYNPGGVLNNIGLPVATPLKSPAGQNSGLRPGDNWFVDTNGDGKLSIGNTTSNMGDLVYLGSDQPRFVFGFNLGAQWNGFDFYAIFQGVGKRTIFRSGNWRVPFTSIFQGQTTEWVGNVWSPDNQNAYYPNLHSALNNGINGYNYQASTWSVENGEYLRLKNLVIGYTLPASIIERTKVFSKVRIYVEGSDLWELTSIHDGWDPEATRTVGGNERYPFYRYVTVGANITF